MITAIVYSKDGKKSGSLELNENIFGARVNGRLLELVLTAYAGNQRRGTHDTKTRKQVRGGGKKPWKQKGTGRARHSSRRSPIWRGGGITFGPHPRDYDTNLPDTMKLQALVSALSLRQKEQNLVLLDNADLKEAKTKELVGIIKALGLKDSRTLFITDSMDEKLKRASGNLNELFSVKLARDVNAYHILRRKKLLIGKGAIQTLEGRLADQAQTAEPQVQKAEKKAVVKTEKKTMKKTVRKAK